MEIGSASWRRLIREGAASWGLAVGERELELFARHAQEMLRWNAVTNLTAITEPAAVARDHFLDSLAAAPWVPAGARLIDVGSGAGFPGVPLHVAVAGLETLLLEAARKKVSFLRHLLRTIDLSGIGAEQGRLEDFAAAPQYRGRFEVVVCRAVTSLERFVPRALPLLREGGRLIALKGPGVEEELRGLERRLQADRALGPLRVERFPYRLPGLREERTVCLISRVAEETGPPRLQPGR